MSKPKRTQSKPRKQMAQALSLDLNRGSVTFLTQDPKVKDGVMVSADSPFRISSPGTVVICGPLTLPGQDFEIHAGTFGTQTDTKGQDAVVDTSAAAWSGTPKAPLPPVIGPDPGNRGSGATGATGETGMNSANITIQADTWKLTTPLTIRAEGGSGGTGQAGQDGGPGIPFSGSFSDGSSGGTGGIGGTGGRGGVITIHYRNLPVPRFDTSVNGGKGGTGGEGGRGGQGADHSGAGTALGPPGKKGTPGSKGSDGLTGPQGEVIIKQID